MSSYPPSGKFKRVSSGELVLPGSCSSCGAIDVVEGFVDFGLSFEFYGVLYLCHNCVFEATQVFSNNPYSKLEDQLVAAQEEIARLSANNQKLETLVDNFALDRVTVRGLDSNSNSNPNVSVVAAAGAAGYSTGSSSSSTGVKRASNSGSAKSTTSKRPADAGDSESGDDILDI